MLLDHDGWEKWFNWTTMKDPVAVDLLKSLKYVETVKEGVKNASRAYFWPYAFLGSKIVLEYIVQEEFKPRYLLIYSLILSSRFEAMSNVQIIILVGQR